MRFFRTSVLCAFCVLSACSSSFQAVSTPTQAEVFYVDFEGGGEKKSLGKTPLDIPMSQIEDLIKSQDEKSGSYFILSFEKAGFVPQKLSVPVSEFGTMVTSLNVKLEEGDSKEQAKLADEILDSFFLAQKLILNKEFQRAQIEVDKIIEKAPEFAKGYSMRASIYFMEKKYDESLKWFEESLKYDPKLETSVQMISRINALTGRRNVAGDRR